MDGAVDGVLHGGEFDQEAVAGELDDGAGMVSDLGLDHLFAGILPGGHGAVGVVFHQARIASHVGRQYRRKPPLNLPLRHVPLLGIH